jgi:hypothetical protein
MGLGERRFAANHSLGVRSLNTTTVKRVEIQQ